MNEDVRDDGGSIRVAEGVPAVDAAADLAEIVLRLARELSYREHRDSLGVSLTPANANIMRHIDRHPGVTAGHVAEATGVLRSNVSTCLRELERIGFVQRRGDPSDGRGVLLYSTAAAAENLARIREGWTAAIGLGARDSVAIAQATRLLDQISDALVAQRRRQVR